MLREGISDLEEQSKSATDSCSNLTPYPQQIEELEHSTEPLKDPPVGGFKFKSVRYFTDNLVKVFALKKQACPLFHRGG